MNSILQKVGVAMLCGIAAGAAAAQDHGPGAAPGAATPAAPAVAATTGATREQSARHGRRERGAASAKKSDHIELGTTTVTGNRELPKVMYIVPWKKSDIGDLGGKPLNSLLDEVLAPVDRDVFRRQIAYYQALSSAASQNGAHGAGSATQGEK